MSRTGVVVLRRTFLRLNHHVLSAVAPVAGKVADAGTEHEEESLQVVLWVFWRSSDEYALGRVQLVNVLGVFPFPV